METQDRAFAILSEFPYSQELDYPLLNEFKAKMVFIKDLLRPFRILVLRFIDSPRQFGHRCQVIHAHVVLLISGTQLFKFLDLSFVDCLRFRWDFHRIKLGFKLFNLIPVSCPIVLTEKRILFERLFSFLPDVLRLLSLLHLFIQQGSDSVHS